MSLDTQALSALKTFPDNFGALLIIILWSVQDILKWPLSSLLRHVEKEAYYKINAYFSSLCSIDVSSILWTSLSSF